MTAVTAAMVIMFTAVFMVVVVMVCTFCICIEQQRACQIIFNHFSCFACYTAEYRNVFLCQRHFCAAADAAADQNGCTLYYQEVCQQAVTAAVGGYDFVRQDFAVSTVKIWNCSVWPKCWNT